MEKYQQSEIINPNRIDNHAQRGALEIITGATLVGAGCYFVGKHGHQEINTFREFIIDIVPYITITVGGIFVASGLNRYLSLNKYCRQLHNYLFNRKSGKHLNEETNSD